jgi:hypothetical protein
LKKWLVIIVAVFGLSYLIVNTEKPTREALVEVMPDSPPFELTDKFDGIWKGERIDVSGDQICSPTNITGSIQQGVVSITLSYNSTILKGWVSGKGEIVLYGTNPKWGYRFDGSAANNRIEGDWFVTNAPCKGHWFVEKLSTNQ